MKDQIMRYRIEFGKSDANRLKAQKLRQKVFRNSENGLDEDQFDAMSDHGLIFDKKDSDRLVLVFRSRTFSSMAPASAVTVRFCGSTASAPFIFSSDTTS